MNQINFYQIKKNYRIYSNLWIKINNIIENNPKNLKCNIFKMIIKNWNILNNKWSKI